MADVFDGTVLTPLAVPDPRIDWLLPPCGALSYASITETSALAGVNGCDTMLLAGNRDRLMHGNENTVIDQNRTHAVTGNQQKTIAGNKKENVHGNFDHQTTGNMARTIVGTTNDLYVSQHTMAHKANQLIDEPIAYLHSIWNTQNKGNTYSQRYGDYYSLTGTYFNVCGVNIDFKGAQLGHTAMENDSTIFHLGRHGLTLKSKEADTHITAIETTIHAIEASVGEAKFHEVALTQKIIVVGANQFM